MRGRDGERERERERAKGDIGRSAISGGGSDVKWEDRNHLKIERIGN